MWPWPRIVAHRGGGILAPENTLAGMRQARASGFRGVEFDVMLSRDGVPVLMHDPEFGRTIPGTGSVAACTAAELGQMDAGSWFGPGFVGEKVPTLAAVADFCRSHGIWMNVEIKPAHGAEAETGAAVAAFLLDRFAAILPTSGGTALLPQVPLLSSFSTVALEAAKSVAPCLPRGLLVRAVPPDWARQCASLGATSLHVGHDSLTEECVARIKASGLLLFCYTVNDPGWAKTLLSWGVDAFCTDRLDLIRPDCADLG